MANGAGSAGCRPVDAHPWASTGCLPRIRSAREPVIAERGKLTAEQQPRKREDPAAIVVRAN
jgi:hypothetical protein